jgi:hypothetical protein
VPVTKTLYTGFTGQCYLALPDLRVSQVVIAQIRRDTGLVMALEQRPAPLDVGPFGKILLPPLVVLLRRIELGQIKCY